MPNYRRPRIPGATIFFTVALAERGSDLLVREIGPLRDALRATLERRPVTIDALVVLPDHLHCVWTLPEGDADFSTRWSAIKARFSRGLDAGLRRPSHLTRREKAIWQRRFWERMIRDDADYAAHVRYCWRNPVKHGFVSRTVDWPFSSIHRDIRLGWVEREWVGAEENGEFGE
jgi:putative transposase